MEALLADLTHTSFIKQKKIKQLQMLVSTSSSSSSSSKEITAREKTVNVPKEICV